jgi:hypothetical protein
MFREAHEGSSQLGAIFAKVENCIEWQQQIELRN